MKGIPIFNTLFTAVIAHSPGIFALVHFFTRLMDQQWFHNSA